MILTPLRTVFPKYDVTSEQERRLYECVLSSTYMYGLVAVGFVIKAIVSDFRFLNIFKTPKLL